MNISDYLGENYNKHYGNDVIKYFKARKKIEDTFDKIARKFYFNLCKYVFWLAAYNENDKYTYSGRIIFYDENEKFELNVPFNVYVYNKNTRLWFPIPINLIEKKIEERYLNALDFDEKIEYYNKKKGNK